MYIRLACSSRAALFHFGSRGTIKISLPNLTTVGQGQYWRHNKTHIRLYQLRKKESKSDKYKSLGRFQVSIFAVLWLLYFEIRFFFLRSNDDGGDDDELKTSRAETKPSQAKLVQVVVPHSRNSPRERTPLHVQHDVEAPNYRLSLPSERALTRSKHEERAQTASVPQ
jgi:hypothetical protein